MRIVLSGAQCTGKTTILNNIEILQQDQVVQKRSKYPLITKHRVIKEVVRELMKEKNVKINKDADHISQCLILEQHYKNCLRETDFISDRGSVDAFVYATWGYINNKFTLEEHIKHEEIFLRSLPYYNYIFYLPVEFEIKEDGVRSIDKEYQNQICKIYESVFRRYEKELPTLIYLRGQVSERMNSIIATLSPYLI